MSSKIEQIDTAIEKYAVEIGDKPVTFPEVYKWISNYLGVNDLDETQLEESLSVSTWFFEKAFEFDGNMHYIHRKRFFKGKQFLIAPTEWEIEKGILIPGHRFFGLLSPTVLPTKVSLSIKETQIQTKKISLPFQQVITALLFFGKAKGLEYLVLDDKDNENKLLSDGDQFSEPESVKVSVTAFDLQEFYNKNNFIMGDTILLTIEYWETGIYKIESAIKAKNLSNDITPWEEDLKSFLLDIFDIYGADIDAENQLAQAYYYSADEHEFDSDGFDLMDNPPMAFSSFFNRAQSDWLSLQESYGLSLFWHKEQDVREEIMEQAMFDAEINRGNDDADNEFDSLCGYIGLSFSKNDITAYIIDALSKKEQSPATIEEKLFKGRSIYAKDKNRLSELVNELWTEIKSEYNKSNDPYIKERKKILKTNDTIIALLRELDSVNLSPEVLIKNEAFLHLNELSAMISQLMFLMNNLKDTSSPALLTHINEIENAATELTNIVREEFLSKNNSEYILQFPDTDKDKDENKIYQLKISLKYTKPPIWRRVLIPANMELEDLHEVIQGVMEWYDCHLHHFIQGNTFYQPHPEPMEDMFFMSQSEMVDSSGVKIRDLLTHEKQKMQYEYDFGDSWIHEIILEKIVEREENKTYPVCIKGKLACPPEDCGGLPGYYSILDGGEFMDKETRDYYMEEIGDPEKFDINSVNDRLKFCCQKE